MLHQKDSFLKLVRQPQHSDLWRDIVDQLATNEAKASSLHSLKQECYVASRALCCEELDAGFWRGIAVQLHLLPPSAANKDVRRVGIRDARGQGEDMFEYLAVPYTVRAGKHIVKGSHCEFKHDSRGGPHTKYEALFVVRPAFYALLCFLSC